MTIGEGFKGLYKRNYCLGDCTNYARFMVEKKLCREKVTDNLYPNMYQRAEEILAENNFKSL